MDEDTDTKREWFGAQCEVEGMAPGKTEVTTYMQVRMLRLRDRAGILGNESKN